MELWEIDDIPETTLRKRLIESGAPPPDDLRLLLERLADINVVIEWTDHLDDAALFAQLQDKLDEPINLPDDPATVTHLDFCNGDDDAYLRYYADDVIRARLLEDYPDDPMPPKEPPPYDRDRFMPKARRDREAACSANHN